MKSSPIQKSEQLLKIVKFTSDGSICVSFNFINEITISSSSDGIINSNKVELGDHNEVTSIDSLEFIDVVVSLEGIDLLTISVIENSDLKMVKIETNIYSKLTNCSFAVPASINSGLLSK
jgi:hypothetical protein